MYLSVGIGVGIIGLLLIPTSALVMLASIVWRTTDGVVRLLGKTCGREEGQDK